MPKLNLKVQPSDKKFQFLNTIYYRPMYVPALRDKFTEEVNDFLVIVYRDEDTDEKKLQLITNPTIEFFVANDDVVVAEDAPNQIELDKVHIEKVKYKHLLQHISNLKDEYTGTKTDFVKKYYRDGNIRKGLYSEAKNFHLWNRVFSSDIDIEDWWKGRFIDKYTQAKRTKLTKSFTDIEVDTINLNKFPDPALAEAPVNAITTFIQDEMTFYTMLLRNPENPQIEELEKSVKKFKKELGEEFGTEYKYKLIWYDDEYDMICSYFALINKFKPDFNLIYNMSFDLVYLLNRLGELEGYTYTDRLTDKKYEYRNMCADIVSHEDFPDFLRVAEYIPDTNNSNKISERIDIFRSATYTQWIDQLCLYASLRKDKVLENYSLSNISKTELHDDKLNYSDSGYSIRTLPYDDYKMFVRYNIKDVLLQYLLERKNNDIDLLYSIADITKTRLLKSMRKTISIKNMKHYFDIDQNYVQGNNHNVIYGSVSSNEPEEQFTGAFVADPELNGYNGVLINGIHSKYIYDYIIDFDYSALYPSIIRAFNIDANTQYGRIQFVGEPATKEYDKGGEFLDCLQTGNIIYLTNNFLHTPTISTIIDKCKKKGLIA